MQVVIWVGGFLFLIDNLGYDITTLVAGLGIGGIAIALAAQTILGDLFSYLVIFFDKPFEIGDFIVVEDKMGTVEYIGIKTTRLRTLGGEQLICSNTDLTNSRVHNYKRMQERRVVFGLGVIYGTRAAQLKIIPKLIRDIIESIDGTRFDRAHFKSFGDFSLNFEVVFYVLSADYNRYMDIQEAINTQIFEVFEKEEIEFAFPTQTLFMNNVTESQPLHV
jgi:small-conductance mechanosensitive channel